MDLEDYEVTFTVVVRATTSEEATEEARRLINDRHTEPLHADKL